MPKNNEIMRRALTPSTSDGPARKRSRLQQHNVFLSAEDESDEGGGGAGTRKPRSGEAGTELPESEYYDIHELIRSKHKGKVEAGRKFYERLEQNNTQTADFNNDAHPLAAMAYFSGMERDETPLPGESTDEEIRFEMELQLKKQLKKQYNPAYSSTPTPKPF